jgi:DNA-directed RNA polymerase specialized sigma24 family protein
MHYGPGRFTFSAVNIPLRLGLLDSLPDKHREVLELLSLGTPRAEIAEQLDLPVEAIDPLIAVARAKLRRVIRERQGLEQHSPAEPG